MHYMTFISLIKKYNKKKYSKMDIKKFEFFKLNENQETENYMFFNNLKTIKRLVDKMLEMNEQEVDSLLKNGHNWAVDHMATSKDDVEEVFNFLAGEIGIEGYEQHNENPLGGPESSHTVHDNHMRNMASEDDDNIKGFEDFSL